MGKLENDYKSQLKRRIEERFPGCMILKNDEQLLPGIPDMTILYGRYWAVLEVKRDANAPYEPNQEYYLEYLGDMGFASVIFPAIEAEVLDAIQRSFESWWESCPPKSQ